MPPTDGTVPVVPRLACGGSEGVVKMADGNRAVVFHGTGNMQVDTVEYPKLVMPNGKKAPHGVIPVSYTHLTLPTILLV